MGFSPISVGAVLVRYIIESHKFVMVCLKKYIVVLMGQIELMSGRVALIKCNLHFPEKKKRRITNFQS